MLVGVISNQTRKQFKFDAAWVIERSIIIYFRKKFFHSLQSPTVLFFILYLGHDYKVLYSGTINFIIFCMCAYKSNINPLYCKFNNNNQPMLVALDIKHIMLITNIVYAVKSFFDIGKALPSGSFYYFQPLLQCSLSIWMF